MTDLDLDQAPPVPTMFRWPSEAAWLAAADAAGFTSTDEDGNTTLVAYTHDRAIDVVGTISRGGEWDDEGNVITPPEVLDGWHINFQGEVPEEWLDYAVWPQNPARVWAGGGSATVSVELLRVRARNEMGQFVGDDPETPDVNEAWVEVSRAVASHQVDHA